VSIVSTEYGSIGGIGLLLLVLLLSFAFTQQGANFIIEYFDAFAVQCVSECIHAQQRSECMVWYAVSECT